MNCKAIEPKNLCGIALIFWLSVSGGLALAEKLVVYTEEFPPYNFTKDGQVIGISTDLVVAALEEAGLEYQLTVLPWKRAYVQTLKQKNTLLFTTSRTIKRESLFIWVAALYPRRIDLFKLKKRSDISVASFEDLNKYQIGVLRGGSVEEELSAKGIKSLQAVNTDSSNLLKLFSGRLDLIPGSELTMAYELKTMEFSYDDIEPAFPLSNQGWFYLVANKETPPEIILRLQDAFNQVIYEGVRDDIRRRYLD